MLITCKYCGRIHERKFDCGQKPVRGRRNKQLDKFRNSKTWQNKRESIRKRDLYLCQVCKENGRYVSNDQGLHVHHIIPLSRDFELRLADDNLITLCTACHELAEDSTISRDTLRKIIAD